MERTQTFTDAVLLLTRDGMGSADRELQHKLLGTYLRLLVENDSLPAVICFYTEGVKLVTEGSPFVEQFSQLEQKGVRLVVCSTCLTYYGLTDSVRVGIVGGMGDILEAQVKAGKVVML